MEYLKMPETGLAEIEQNLTGAVCEIIQKIRESGRIALTQFSRKFDNYQGSMVIGEKELSYACETMPEDTRSSILSSIDHVRDFHRRQRKLFNDFIVQPGKGISLGMRFTAVERAGIYVPGGRYPLPSSAIMTVIPAQEAGVSEIYVCSPPTPEGYVHSLVLGTLYILGIKEVFVLGGAQAIAAMAMGISPVPKCDIIAGPGNAYVTEAKRQLVGTVGIDSLAGPSEVLIIADGTADIMAVALDLIAQAEHDPLSRSVLFATDKELAIKIQELVESLIPSFPTGNIISLSWQNNGTIICGTLNEAIEFSNQYAPEHLQIITHEPERVLSRCQSFGAAFLGPYCSVPFGDYIAGTNHVLPTNRSARFSSGLWTGTFIKAMTYVQLEQDKASELAYEGIPLAEAEGLLAHAQSMRYRIKMRGEA
ncbi:MAG TPA: histidinol dehydrogenase [Synergistales bacterium]|nr:histidinol dehydrogenase [Synergistales bacterium]